MKYKSVNKIVVIKAALSPVTKVKKNNKAENKYNKEYDLLYKKTYNYKVIL